MDASEATILLVEDHTATRRFLAENLTADGFSVLEAASLQTGRGLLRQEHPDLAIIDLSLPDGDGLELVSLVRGTQHDGTVDPDLPLLILSGRGRELEVLRGFSRGCDEYVVKPFSYPELHARVGALLRRSQKRARSRRIRVGPLAIDPLSRQVWLEEQPVKLSNKEFLLLRTLAADPTRVFTRAELLRAVWGVAPSGVVTRSLDSHAVRLRRKLREAGGAGLVVNAWGVGYRLTDGTLV
jgi:DNA-binding response OmpR family regulator